jgi:uncharacterized protein YdgA (DUF945 family)
MQSPRSRNVNRKPKAQHWINKDFKRSALFIEAIRTLEAGYGGDYSGFVDFAPPEYRFNGESGGYVILCARSKSVRVHVQLGPDNWKERAKTNEFG